MFRIIYLTTFSLNCCYYQWYYSCFWRLIHLFLLPYLFALAAWDFRMVICETEEQRRHRNHLKRDGTWFAEALSQLSSHVHILVYNIDRPPTYVVRHLTLESPTQPEACKEKLPCYGSKLRSQWSLY